MTKTVRIENADMSNYHVVVEVWDLSNIDGMLTDRLVETKVLHNPTQLLETYITSTRYLVVKEATKI